MQANTNEQPYQQTSIMDRIRGFIGMIGLFTKFMFLIVITIYIFEFFFYDKMVQIGGFNFFLIIQQFQLWRLITFVFLHASILHVLFNMLYFLLLGTLLERKLGFITMIIHMVSSLVMVDAFMLIVQTIIFFATNQPTPQTCMNMQMQQQQGKSGNFFTNFFMSIVCEYGVGYSGIIFSMVVCFVVFYPEIAGNCCGCRFPEHLLPWILLLVSQLMGGVSFIGHLAGIIAGYIFCYVILKRAFVQRLIRTIEGKMPNAITSRIYTMDENVFPQTTSILPTQWGSALRSWRNRRGGANAQTNSNSTEATSDQRFQGPGRTLSGTRRPQQYSHTQATINPDDIDGEQQTTPQQEQPSRLSNFFNTIRSNIQPMLNRRPHDENYAHLRDDEEEMHAYVSDDDDLSIPGDDDDDEHTINPTAPPPPPPQPEAESPTSPNSSHFDSLGGGRKLGSN